MKERKRVEQGKDGRETGLATCVQHFCSGSRLESSDSEPNASHIPDFSEGGQTDRRREVVAMQPNPCFSSLIVTVGSMYITHGGRKFSNGFLRGFSFPLSSSIACLAGLCSCVAL